MWFLGEDKYCDPLYASHAKLHRRSQRAESEALMWKKRAERAAAGKVLYREALMSAFAEIATLDLGYWGSRRKRQFKAARRIRERMLTLDFRHRDNGW